MSPQPAHNIECSVHRIPCTSRPNCKSPKFNVLGPGVIEHKSVSKFCNHGRSNLRGLFSYNTALFSRDLANLQIWNDFYNALFVELHFSHSQWLFPPFENLEISCFLQLDVLLIYQNEQILTVVTRTTPSLHTRLTERNNIHNLISFVISLHEANRSSQTT